MDSIERILFAHPFFSGLPSEPLKALAANASLDVYAPGDYLFHTGEPAGRCFVIQEGRVAIEVFDQAKGTIVLETVGEPSVIGWSWLLEPREWSVDAQATTLSRVISLDARVLHETCENDEVFGFALYLRFSEALAQHFQALLHRFAESQANPPSK